MDVLFILERPAHAANLAALQNFLRYDEPDEETYLTDAVRIDQPGADIDLPAEAPNVNLDVEFYDIGNLEVDDLLPRDVLFLMSDEETFSDEEDPAIHDSENESNDGDQPADPLPQLPPEVEIHVSSNGTQWTHLPMDENMQVTGRVPEKMCLH